MAPVFPLVVELARLDREFEEGKRMEADTHVSVFSGWQ